MIAQRDELQPERKGAEKNHKLQKKIIHIATTMKELQRKIDKLPREEFLRSNGQQDFALKVEEERKTYATQMEDLSAKHEKLHEEYDELVASNQLGSEAAKIALAA